MGVGRGCYQAQSKPETAQDSCFVLVVISVVVVVLIVVAVHKGLVVVDKSLSDTH